MLDTESPWQLASCLTLVPAAGVTRRVLEGTQARSTGSGEGHRLASQRVPLP